MNGILFDFNGTMFWDGEFVEVSWRQFIKDLIGRSCTDEELKKYIHGRSAVATFSYFFDREVPVDEALKLITEKEKLYRKIAYESGRFYLAPGLPKLLDKLKESGVPFTIATASILDNVEFYFEHFGLGKWFDLSKVVYDDGTFPGKPAPDIYLKAADKIGIDIKNCTVLEDAISGINAAQNAGAGKVIGVASLLDEKRLYEEGVDWVVKDFRDAEEVFKKILD